MIELATCSWRKFHPAMGVPVRITLGKPPRWFAHPHEEIRQLAPPRKVLRIADSDWEEFRRKYRHHLYRMTPERLQRIFDEISEKHGGRRLVLLCFEGRVEDCHRGEFASWWQRQTGEQVPELERTNEEQTTAAQPALFDELPREERT